MLGRRRRHRSNINLASSEHIVSKYVLTALGLQITALPNQVM